MSRLVYKSWKPRAEAAWMVERINEICKEEAAQGYTLTLRQLYYKLVGRGWFPEDRRWRRIEGTNKWVRDPNGTKNADPNYNWLGSIVNEARLAGMLDWDYIVDRTRSLAGSSYFSKPGDAILKASRKYAEDVWATQPLRIEVWVEKEALAEVVGRAAAEHSVDYFACRGYVSQSEMWSAGQRLLDYIERGQRVLILHLGDHDPSGIDMTRDIDERLHMFMERDFHRAHVNELGSRTTTGAIRAAMRAKVGGYTPLEVRRIALTMEQVERYNPPPDPARLTDARYQSYLEAYGDESWELDALENAVIHQIITGHIVAERDDEAWEAAVSQEEENRGNLVRIAERWDDIVALSRGKDALLLTWTKNEDNTYTGSLKDTKLFTLTHRLEETVHIMPHLGDAVRWGSILHSGSLRSAQERAEATFLIWLNQKREFR